MIVYVAGEDLWLFDQNDHAALCGAMAAAWGAPPFATAPMHAHRAAAYHDNGWREWDARPRLDPATGRPHHFTGMPPADYLAIWRRGLARAWAEDEAVGLLVSLHAMRFFGRRTGSQDRALYAEERRRQAGALALLGAPGADADALPEPWATWHACVFFWDALSLLLCGAWEPPWFQEVPTGAGERCAIRVERVDARGDDADPGGVLTLAPFPFVEALRLEAPARVIPRRMYGTQADLDVAMQAAERRTVRWRLRPAGGGSAAPV